MRMNSLLFSGLYSGGFHEPHSHLLALTCAVPGSAKPGSGSGSGSGSRAAAGTAVGGGASGSPSGSAAGSSSATGSGSCSCSGSGLVDAALSEALVSALQVHLQYRTEENRTVQ